MRLRRPSLCCVAVPGAGRRRGCLSDVSGCRGDREWWPTSGRLSPRPLRSQPWNGKCGLRASRRWTPGMASTRPPWDLGVPAGSHGGRGRHGHRHDGHGRGGHSAMSHREGAQRARSLGLRLWDVAGHPEKGEEAFVICSAPNTSVSLHDHCFLKALRSARAALRVGWESDSVAGN